MRLSRLFGLFGLFVHLGRRVLVGLLGLVRLECRAVRQVLVDLLRQFGPVVLLAQFDRVLLVFREDQPDLPARWLQLIRVRLWALQAQMGL